MSLHPDMSEQDYRALPGLSGTQVATILESPMKYRWELDHPRERTSAMGFGTIVHALVLGQPLPCVVSEYDDFKTKAAREWKAAQESSGLIVVKADVMNAAFDAAASVDRHPVASALLNAPGKSEVSVKTEYRGYVMRGRLDRLPDVGPVVDFKTDKDITPSGIQWSMAEYGYATQLAHYAALVDRPEAPLIVAVENTAPYRVAVYQLDALTWNLAQRATALAWDIYADCMDTNTWPSGLADDVTEIGLKPWAYDELELRVNPDAYREIEVA